MQANGFYSIWYLTMPFSIVFIVVQKIPQALVEDRFTSQVTINGEKKKKKIILFQTPYSPRKTKTRQTTGAQTDAPSRITSPG